MARWPWVFVHILTALNGRACAQNEKPDPKAGTPKFRTEPSFYPETFNFTHHTEDLSLLAPGYIFIAPIAKFFDWGPQIYDLDGDLIFYGDDLAGSGIQKHVEDFKVCDYLGQKGTHLCLHDGLKRGVLGGPRPYGRKAFLDQTYTQVSVNYTYPDEINNTYPNSHEFRPVENGYSFIVPIYVPRQMDLTPYLGKKDGWVWDACFAEIDVRTADSKFDWCYMDWYEVWQSNLFFRAPGSPNITSEKAGGGDGYWPWDAFHINAIDKNAEGDFLVSIRHLDQILKIAGENNRQGVRPGTTIWRLGGKANDFDMGRLMFSKQHAVRAVSVSSTEETFSLFDNAWEGTNKPSANVSAGKVITINNETMKAWSIREFPHPNGEITPSQGNMQDLPNGNVLIGWGNLPELTEYHENGTALWHASFNKDDQRLGFSYRAFKSPWTGTPRWSPKLLAYSQSCSPSTEKPLRAYVSWNGATEVERWDFFTSTLAEGPWIPAGTVAREGFETGAMLSSRLTSALSPFMPYVSVNAVDKHGRVLASANTTTFVPKGRVPVKCNEHGCELGFKYESKYNFAGRCDKSYALPLLAFVLVIAVLEVISYVAEKVEIWVVDVQRGSPDGAQNPDGGPLNAQYGKTVGYHQA